MKHDAMNKGRHKMTENNDMKENDPLLDITSASMTCVAEMTTALEKLKAVIKKSRYDFEGDLIANWNVDQCSKYSKMLYESAAARKQRLQELLTVPEIQLLNPPDVVADIPHGLDGIGRDIPHSYPVNTRVTLNDESDF
jgi:hypothetical protein